LYGVVVAPFVTVTSIVFVASALTSVSVIALPAVGKDVGDGVAVTVTVGAGLALTVTVGASVSVGMTISGDGVGVGVAATDAFVVAALAVGATGGVGGTNAGWNGLRPTAAV
jgi:hypothetical protein